MAPTMTRDDLVAVAEAAIHATLGGTLADLTATVHPDATNREAIAEPPDTRGRGPQAFHATGEWLRAAFSDLTWTTEQSIAEGDLVVTYGLLSGRHTGTFVVWTPEATVERAFVPTGRTVSVRQAHFQRIRDGLVIEHWAVRDDQGMAIQAGWIPPTPAFLIRCASATRKARRARA
ncbi:MAG: ester cyclase [Actinobacteria bacterium]|nr:ester cyclase [Actinomycetota bacterium]